MKAAHCPDCGLQEIEARGLIEWSPSKNDWIITELGPEVYCRVCNNHFEEEDLVYKKIKEERK